MPALTEIWTIPYSNWFQIFWYSERQARRLLEDYDEMPIGRSCHSISFVEYHDEWLEFVFVKHMSGSVTMFMIDYDR